MAFISGEITWPPNDLRRVGYSSSDIPVLVEGALLQARFITLAPPPAGAEDLARTFHEALTVW